MYFGALHSRLDFIYGCTCSDCKHKPEQLILAANPKIKQFLNTVEKAFKTLHKKGNYKPEDLDQVPEYNALITATNTVLNTAFEDNNLSSDMLESLEKDVFYFSALKTHAQLFEASRQLLTTDKKIKSFAQFSNDVSKIKSNYIENYLEAELDFAKGSILMAERWELFSEGDRYVLQYRTAKDDKVRITHEALHNITLPKDDPFWDLFFPPNGWRCRCTVVQVLKALEKSYDSKKAYKAGEAATTQINKNGKNKLEIFRFNAGKQKVVFPPNHPYNKVKGAKIVKANIDQKTREKEPVFTPKNITGYESKLDVKINREIFSFLKEKVPLVHESKISKGAYYSPQSKHVHIPIDARRKRSKWWAEGVYYHEYGHVADWHNNIRKSKKVGDLMTNYRKEFAKEKSEKYKSVHENIIKKYYKAREEKDYDSLEKIGASADTLMSLNPNFGFGHTKTYFKGPGKKEAEFIAHAFENKYIGNNIFKELMPELYKDMIKLVEEFKPK